MSPWLTIAETVGSGAILAGVVAAARTARRTLRENRAARDAFLTRLDEQDTLMAARLDEHNDAVSRRMDGFDAALGRIEAETKLNGGKSLKDAVIRSEGKMDAFAGQLSRHLEDAKYQQGRLDAFVAGAPRQ